MKRRDLLGSLAGIAAIGSPAFAQDHYPSRHVRWVVPFAAGGPNDMIARKLAELASPIIGQPIIIDNKPGASGALGTREIARAAPDGYNLAIGIPDSLISVTSLVKSVGYDARSDLTPIALIADALGVLVAHRDLGVNAMAGLVKIAAEKPDTITYASWGQGSTPHLIMSSVARISRTQFINVPYRGLAPATQDFLGKQIQLLVVPTTWVAQYGNDGAVVPLAIVGNQRALGLPSVPTLAEQGFKAPILQASPWIGLVGPKGLPPAIIQRWEAVLTQAIGSPEFSRFLGTVGFAPRLKLSGRFAVDLAAEFATTTQLIRDMGIAPE